MDTILCSPIPAISRSHIRASRQSSSLDVVGFERGLSFSWLFPCFLCRMCGPVLSIAIYIQNSTSLCIRTRVIGTNEYESKEMWFGEYKIYGEYEVIGNSLFINYMYTGIAASYE